MTAASPEIQQDASISRAANGARSISAIDRRLRAGIVGAGLMGRWHAYEIEKVGGKVEAIADLDLSAAQRLSARYNGCVAYSNVDVMLEKRELDVLHICSPTLSHEPIAFAALEAGINVMIEKPMAADLAGSMRLLDKAESCGRLLCPVHQFVFQKGVQSVKDTLPRIGDLIHVESVIYSAGGEGQSADHLDTIAQDIIPHPLSLIEELLPGYLDATRCAASRPAAGELRVHWTPTRGTSVSMIVSMNARPTMNSLTLQGTLGRISLNLFHGYAVYEEGGKASRRRKAMQPFVGGLRGLATAGTNLADRLRRREFAYPGLRLLIDKFYRSIRTGGGPPFSRHQVLNVAGARDQIIEIVWETRNTITSVPSV